MAKMKNHFVLSVFLFWFSSAVAGGCVFPRWPTLHAMRLTHYSSALEFKGKASCPSCLAVGTSDSHSVNWGSIPRGSDIMEGTFWVWIYKQLPIQLFAVSVLILNGRWSLKKFENRRSVNRSTKSLCLVLSCLCCFGGWLMHDWISTVWSTILNGQSIKNWIHLSNKRPRPFWEPSHLLNQPSKSNFFRIYFTVCLISNAPKPIPFTSA
jgi:hypothetical protein